MKKTWVKKMSTSIGSETKKKEPISCPHDKEICRRGNKEIIAAIVI
jgi:hypothetical protein